MTRDIFSSWTVAFCLSLTAALVRAETIVSVRLDVADLNGAPITQIAVGQSLLLRAFVEDVRSMPTTPGVAAAYLDVTWEPQLAAVGGPIRFGDNYLNGHLGNESALPGLLNEVGGFTSNNPFPGAGEYQLFQVPMSALASGDLHFAADASDQGLATDFVLSDLTVAPTSKVNYGATTLRIVPEPATWLSLGIAMIGTVAFGTVVKSFGKRCKPCQ